MVSEASHAGDADSSLAPDRTSDFRVPMDVHLICILLAYIFLHSSEEIYTVFAFDQKETVDKSVQLVSSIENVQLIWLFAQFVAASGSAMPKSKLTTSVWRLTIL